MRKIQLQATNRPFPVWQADNDDNNDTIDNNVSNQRDDKTGGDVKAGGWRYGAVANWTDASDSDNIDELYNRE